MQQGDQRKKESITLVRDRVGRGAAESNKDRVVVAQACRAEQLSRRPSSRSQPQETGPNASSA